jgi:hypothetical protein
MNSTNSIGYTSSTPNNLLIDAGALYKNYGEASEALICATSGGNDFEIKLNTREVKCDGVKGKVKGLIKVISTDVTLKANLLEITSALLQMALISQVDTGVNSGFDTITGKTDIALTDYIDNIAIVGRLSGSLQPIIIIMKNVISSGGLKLSPKDASDNVLPVEFYATFDPANPTLSPYEIRYPQVGALAPFYMTLPPIINGGKIRLEFSDTVQSAALNLTGFTASLLGAGDVVSAGVRDVNRLNVIMLTLTTPPTSGQAVTIAYTQPVTDGNRVKSAAGGLLATFPITSVVNN